MEMDRKLVVDVALKTIGEQNSEVRHAETFTLTALGLFLAAFGVAAAALIKSFSDIESHWKELVLFLVLGGSLGYVIAHAGSLKIKRAAESLEHLHDVLHKHDAYVIWLVGGAYSTALYNIGERKFKALPFTVNFIRRFFQGAMYGGLAVLIIVAILEKIKKG